MIYTTTHTGMIKKILLPLALLMAVNAFPQTKSEPETDNGFPFPVRGLCIAAPQPQELGLFLKFIDEELAPRNVNTLVLRVDYNFEYESHPELRDSVALSKQEVKKLVQVCRSHGIRLIPQVNLLGHQSWAEQTHNLLRVYPEFDETPNVKMPEKYVWPNPDGLYCKSYCPLHPEVHKVVFALVDEVCEAFEADAFHAGLDEVFFIGEEQCPRCAGKDKAELFAGEVRKIRDHLAEKNRTLWMWGDRLIDGRSTGIGEWEGSFNGTHYAVDMIPKDVVICDWHYERPEQTPVYFAMKGLSVVACPWNRAEVARLQVGDMLKFREHSNPVMKVRYLGVMQTVWAPAGAFLAAFYGQIEWPVSQNEVNCFKALFEEINAHLPE